MVLDLNDEVLKVPEEGLAELPAESAEVVEARDIPAEVGPLLDATSAAQGVLQVGVHLDILDEPRCLDLDDRGGHNNHVGLSVVESNAEQLK